MKNEKSNITNAKIVLSDNYLINTITKLLMKEKPVAILGFGYLETKELSGKKTVLYKTADSGNSVMKDFYSNNTDSEFISLLQEKISSPLKTGKIVLLEEVGTFNPMKNSDGSFRLSFIPAVALRNKLNGNESVTKSEKENKDNVAEKDIILPIAEEKSNREDAKITNEEKTQLVSQDLSKKDEFVFPPVEKTEKKEEAVKSLVLVKNEKKDVKSPDLSSGNKVLPNNNVVQTPTSSKEVEKPKAKPISSSKPVERSMAKKTSSVGKVLFDADSSKNKGSKKKKKKLLKWTILSVVFVIVVFVGLAVFIENQEDKQEAVDVTVNGEEKPKTLDIFSLSERYYGSSAFWVYIYEANQDRLKSPVNIPQNIELLIPDLSEKGINPKDSIEIKYAKLKADTILSKK